MSGNTRLPTTADWEIEDATDLRVAFPQLYGNVGAADDGGDYLLAPAAKIPARRPEGGESGWRAGAASPSPPRQGPKYSACRPAGLPPLISARRLVQGSYLRTDSSSRIGITGSGVMESKPPAVSHVRALCVSGFYYRVRFWL